MPVKFEWYGEEFLKDMKSAIKAGLPKIADDLKKAIQREVSKPGSGRIYRTRTGTHQASLPGSPPALDTGGYRKSIRVKSAALTGTEPKVVIESTSNFGLMLEYGTRRMRPRPHFRPVLKREAKKLVDKFADDINRKIK